MLTTRRCWKDQRSCFELLTSRLVITEASRGDPIAAAERLSALAGISLVEVSDDARRLGGQLVASAALPAKALIDAIHLATAAVNGIDFLLTWNCKHLANAMLRDKIERVCRESGYKPPIICTPHALMEIKL